MTVTLRRTVALLACATALLLAGCSSSNAGSSGASTPPGTSATTAASSSVDVGSSPDTSAFVGTWNGHGRTLTVDSAGLAKESIGDGCCDPQLTLTFTLTSSVPGPPGNTVATTKVTAVTRYPGFDLTTAPPAIGAMGLLALADGVITDSFTGTTYCDTAHASTGSCGA